MAKVLVSIVIVNWNGRRFLKDCLGSVYAQRSVPFEVIVVDNGSTDDSLDFIKKNFPKVVIIKNERNLGFAKGNNQGMEIAKGKYILTLNNDTVLKDGFLEELVKAAEGSPGDAGMWAVKILSFDKETIDSVGGLLIYADGLAKGRGRLEKDRGQYDSPVDVFIPSACAGLYRKTMLDSIGRFDEDFFAYCEDTDLGLRGRLAGWKTVSVPNAVVYHYYSGTTGRYTPIKAFLVERNRLWLAAKNLPPSMLCATPFYMIWRYIVQGYGILTGKGAGGRFVEDRSKWELIIIVLKSYFAAITGMPSILRKRSFVQKRRKVTAAEVKGWFRKWRLSAAGVALVD
ncbi:MAG: glycosyltransferase family 2 protein [Deltaproteobacteria bacterium]|nr:glycosyltransferase family 2 protein [Deltaproteobacteria bacterium]